MTKGIGGAVFVVSVLVILAIGRTPTPVAAQATTDPHPGQLTIIRNGEPEALCPLEGTAVSAQISGFGARVTVVQTFTNPTDEAIEAIYAFPLPADAAVDRMRLQVGDRTIEGRIARREEARRIYDAARAAGQTAALLDQERPNIFTQHVANITPGARVQVEISYVQMLPYEEGEFEFVFPMVVGPRFLGNASDPEQIAPPITPEGTRTGANIDLHVVLDAGAPIRSLQSVLHDVRTERLGDGRASVRLERHDEIPNRDFILRYRVATDRVQTAFLTHMDPNGKGGFFTLMLMPPRAPAPEQIAPREVIFVIDQSGSQRGAPIEQSKALTRRMLDAMRPGDTFNVLGFSNAVTRLWPAPRANTPEHVAEAGRFIEPMQANGGTQFQLAVIEALEGQHDPERLRMIVFNSDGFVGNEQAILDYTQRHRGTARIFTFGIGNSVNRFLIDALSVEGRGDSEIVTLNTGVDEVVERFVRRTQSPVLTDLAVRFDGADVGGVTPEHIPDVFSEAPVIVSGRYPAPGAGRVTVSGRLGGTPWSQTIDVQFGAGSEAPALVTHWARRRVDDLTRRNWLVSRFGEEPSTTAAEITDLALEFGIMSEFTSFVAVEPRVVNVGGRPRTVRVPVEMADGVRYDGIFGGLRAEERVAGGGGGGGGFAGRSAAGALALQAPIPQGQAQAALDAEDDRLLRERLESLMSPEDARTARYERKVAETLRQADGEVAVMVWLSTHSEQTLAALRQAGLTIEVRDEALRIVFGTCRASILIELAQLAEVERIAPLE